MRKRLPDGTRVTEPEAWESLRVGDRVRIVRLPTPQYCGRGYLTGYVREDYHRLIRAARSHRVCEIDEWGIPWFWTRITSGRRSGYWLCIDLADDSWVRVKSRARSQKGVFSRGRAGRVPGTTAPCRRG
jgi:hypothetical protein